jgi:hypothetical protein
MTEPARRLVLWLALAALLTAFVAIDWVYVFRR